MSNEINRLFRRKLNEYIENKVNAISSGLCADYTSYKEQTSYIKGMEDAYAAFKDVLSEYVKDESGDEEEMI